MNDDTEKRLSEIDLRIKACNETAQLSLIIITKMIPVVCRNATPAELKSIYDSAASSSHDALHMIDALDVMRRRLLSDGQLPPGFH